MKRERAFVRWRKRANSAETSLRALEQIFADATGMSVTTYQMKKAAELMLLSPRTNVRITGISLPGKKTRKRR